MIISHSHRFIFFAVPKTGTHSIRRALRPQLADADLEQVGLFVEKRFPYPELASHGHGHLSYAQVRPVIGAECMDGYFKFAFVRNPYDRFVSYCAFMGRDSPDFQRQPVEAMKFLLRHRPPVDHVLFRPQYELLCDSEGRLAMDFVGRTERAQADFDTVCAKVGIASSPLEQANRSTHRHYTEYYDDELRSLVATFYRRDLDVFGYEFAA